MRSAPALLPAILLCSAGSLSDPPGPEIILTAARAMDRAHADMIGGGPSASWTQCPSTIAAYGSRSGQATMGGQK